MRWEDERYVRLYTRDTPDWLALSWQARAVFYELMRKVERAGMLPLGKSQARGLAAALHIPVEIVEPALAELVADGCITLRDGVLVLPNFLPAQEATQTDRARKQKSRESARARALGHETGPVTIKQSQNVTDSHDRTSNVTDSHTPSRSVTLCLDETKQDEREGAPARVELGYTHGPGASLTTIPPNLALDDAYRGVAAENMLTDVETVFASFKAHHELKLTMGANWLAGWRKWCAHEKNIQARERQRPREGPSRFEPKPPSPGGMSPRVRKPQEPAAPRELAASLGRALVDNLGGSPVEVVRTHTATDVEPRTSESHGGNGSPLPPVDTTSRRTEAPESVPTFDLADSDPAPDFDQDDPSEDWLAASGDT